MAIGEKRTLLVTGADGQLGRSIRDISSKYNFKFIFTDLDELDITDRAAVEQMIEREQPYWVVNCAAYTDVDGAEGDRERAELINSSAVEILASSAEKFGAGIIHISTDYVFAGDDPMPRVEDDLAEPKSIYGATKLEGEMAATKNPKHIILRTSWLYSKYGKNFVKTMRRLGAERSSISVVSDQWGSPTSADDLAKAVLKVASTDKYGLYHYSNEGVASWALFAEQIMELSGLSCNVEHITTDQYPTAAKRPEFSIMSKSKFTKTFKVLIPEWEASLEELIHRL